MFATIWGFVFNVLGINILVVLGIVIAMSGLIFVMLDFIFNILGIISIIIIILGAMFGIVKFISDVLAIFSLFWVLLSLCWAMFSIF